jgi:DNA-binding response OmpR family regulator
MGDNEDTVKLADGVELNVLGHYILKNDGTRHFLSSLEYKVLMYFISRKNEKIFVVDMINFLDYEKSKSYIPQNVYTIINRLRKKLKYGNTEVIQGLRPGYILLIE